MSEINKKLTIKIPTKEVKKVIGEKSGLKPLKQLPKRPYPNENSTDELFAAYFHKKVSAFIFMIEQGYLGVDGMAPFKAMTFFDEIYHHLVKKEDVINYKRVFQWLKLFFSRFPNVKAVQKKKAVKYLQLVYGLFNGESVSELLYAYFHNKVTVIVFMIERGFLGVDGKAPFKAMILFDDIYTDLIKLEHQTSHARIFQWLKLFFLRFPKAKAIQKRKAIEYIRIVYGLFGLKLNPMI